MVNDRDVEAQKTITLNVTNQPVRAVANSIAVALGGHWEETNGISVFRKALLVLRNWMKVPSGSGYLWGEGVPDTDQDSDDVAQMLIGGSPGSVSVLTDPQLQKQIGEEFAHNLQANVLIDGDFDGQLSPKQKKQLEDQFGPKFKAEMEKNFGPEFQKKMQDQFGPKFQAEMQKQFGPEFQKKLQEQFGSKFQKQMQDQFGPKFQKQMEAQFGPKFQKQMEDQFGPKFQKQMEDQFGPKFQEKIEKQFGPEFEKKIEDQFGPKFQEKIEKQFGPEFQLKMEKLGEQMEKEMKKQSFVQDGLTRFHEAQLFRWTNSVRPVQNLTPRDSSSRSPTPRRLSRRSKDICAYMMTLTRAQKAMFSDNSGSFDIQVKINGQEAHVRKD